MHCVIEKIVHIPTVNRLYRCFGSVTTPQLMRLVNDLDKRIYRLQYPINPHTTTETRSEPTRSPFLDKIFEANPQNVMFGKLADSAGVPKVDNVDIEGADEPANDHHLRLSRTGRNHEPAWYLFHIHRLCKEGDTKAATEMFFQKMLTIDRVKPDRNMIHVLLDGLADVGDSDSAFKVYLKMSELGFAATNSTYSRLFRACSEDIAAWQRENRYKFLPRNYSSELSLQPDLDAFAGPALQRAKNLWNRLHDRGFRMNRITYNTLLQALAKAGDLHTCFQALDAMLLGRGGLPPPLVKPTPINPDIHLPPFRPDEYTLTAVLSAIQQAARAGFLASQPLEALRLALHTWHLIVPRLVRQQPSLHHFTLLAGIVGLVEPRISKFTLPVPPPPVKKDKAMERCFFEVVPESLPRLREPTTPPCPRVLASAKSARELLRRTALLAAGKDVPSPPKTATSVVPTATLTPVNPESCLTVDWTNVDVIMRSPINLLLPVDQQGVKVQLPCKEDLPKGYRSLQPWQRLALLGGLEGFLECITGHFKLTHTPVSPLFTKMVALLPPPADNTTADLDRWETTLLTVMQSSGVVLDLPILNALLQRRTTHGLPVEQLMALANRHGLSPDEYTWGSLARGVRNSKEVREFLLNYSKAASAAASSTSSSSPDTRTGVVRPSLHVYATLMASTKFCWDSKILLLRSMMGSGQLTTKPRKKKSPQKTDQPLDSPILPNRRIIANLELEISNFRDLVARGVIPKDGSSVAASDETGGVVIPPHSLRAFKKFLPIYKEWAEGTVVSDAPLET